MEKEKSEFDLLQDIKMLEKKAKRNELFLYFFIIIIWIIYSKLLLCLKIFSIRDSLLFVLIIPLVIEILDARKPSIIDIVISLSIFPIILSLYVIIGSDATSIIFILIYVSIRRARN